MENCLWDLRDKNCLPYLDDILVFSDSFEEHMKHVRGVLRCLKKKGIKLKPRKCLLFRREVKFLGSIISEEGSKMDPGEFEAVRKLADMKPETVGEVRKLTGLLGYYRKYIPNFSRRAKLLYSVAINRANNENKA
jgi:hypothetical protein